MAPSRPPARPSATSAKAAARDSWTDDEGVRRPAGEVHAWVPGQNQTVCGVPLARAGLVRFPHVAFADTDPLTGAHADAVRWVCPRCAAAGGRPRGAPRWQRRDPRP